MKPQVYRNENFKKIFEKLPPPSGSLTRILILFIIKISQNSPPNRHDPLAPCLVINWHFALAIFPKKVGGWKGCFRDLQVVWSCKQQKNLLRREWWPQRSWWILPFIFYMFFQKKKKVNIPLEMKRIETKNSEALENVSSASFRIVVKLWYRGVSE